MTGLLAGVTVVMLSTTGARSGQTRTWPVSAIPDGDRYVIVASNYGRPRNPAWYHNLPANPRVTIEVAGQTFEVHAHVAEGAERDRLWRHALRIYPGWTVYEQQAKPYRDIPVIVLVPRREGGQEDQP